MKARLVDEFVHEATSPEDNLPHCALLMARVAYPELDPVALSAAASANGRDRA